MSSEHVRELLSEYLDNVLATEERQRVAAHLHSCQECSDLLADFRRLDALLRSQVRVSPAPALRERIFSSPRYLALTGTSHARMALDTVPRRSVRPRLVALPGGLQLPPDAQDRSPASTTPLRLHQARRHSGARGLRVMQAMIAAVLLLTLGVGGLIGWDLWHQQQSMAHDPNALVPPSGPQQGPIPAGTRFVFLRDGALWSGATDGSSGVRRLTPATVAVAQGWVVEPAPVGRTAGDLLAYIDLQKGYVHTVRSDGQRDTIIQQPLLKPDLSPASIWDTDLGNALLNSLAWSPDGTTLAFVADPAGSGQPGLYLASLSSGKVSTVTLPTQGAVSHPVWSPDGVRVAFELAHTNDVSILDYNTANQGVLVILDSAHTNANPTDTVLTLDWSPDAQVPEVTWTTGLISGGHIHTIWSRRVGIGGMTQARLLRSGDYSQTLYHRDGSHHVGSWLLLTGGVGTPGTIERLDLDLHHALLANNHAVIFALWSPDDQALAYLEATSLHIGALHVVSAQTGQDLLVASHVITDLAPVWSPDGQHLAYSTDMGTFVTATTTADTAHVSIPPSAATALCWSASTPPQLIVATQDQPAIYLVDMQHHVVKQLDTQGLRGPLLWTQIP